MRDRLLREQWEPQPLTGIYEVLWQFDLPFGQLYRHFPYRRYADKEPV